MNTIALPHSGTSNHNQAQPDISRRPVAYDAFDKALSFQPTINARRQLPSHDRVALETMRLVESELQTCWRLLNALTPTILKRFCDAKPRRVRTVIINWVADKELELNHETIGDHLRDAKAFAKGANPLKKTQQRLTSMKHRRHTLWKILLAAVEAMYGYVPSLTDTLPDDLRALLLKKGIDPTAAKDALLCAAKFWNDRTTSN